MLDNFTPGRVRDTVAGLEKMGLRGRVRLEASGGITEKNIGRYARTGVDIYRRDPSQTPLPGWT